MNAVAPSPEPEAEDHWAKDLTMQEEMFVLEYIANGGNKLAAARAAGYAQPQTQGYRLAVRDRIQTAIRFKRDELSRSRHLSPDRILEELAIMADFDLGKILTNGHLDLTKVRGEHTRAIAAIEHSTKGGYKVKTHDKQAALRLLMDHLGMLKTSQTNIQINVGFGERMAMRRARALDDR